MDHTGFSEHNYYIIQNINNIVGNSLHEISIAVNDVTSKVIEPHTAVNNIAEIGCFQNGALISTNILNADQILSASTSSTKVLYLWDVDWMYLNYNYEWLYDTLTNKNLHIIVRSESHKKALLNLCDKQPLGVLQDFKLESIWNLLESIKTK